MSEPRPLRVILDDRPLRNALTGVGNYIAQLLQHTSALSSEVEVTPFMHRHLLRRDWRTKLNESSPPVASTTDRAPSPASVGGRIPWVVRSVLQSAYATAFRSLAGRYQLYHEPNHIPMRSRLPTVTTIHDLSVIVHPEWHPRDRVKWYKRDFTAGVRQTRHFIAASQFTRREMVDRLGIAPERITVTYQAPRAAFCFGSESDAPLRRDRPELPERYFLFVGTLEPRKNVDGLLDAYVALPSDIRREHSLLIAGAWGWKAEALRSKLVERALTGDVRLLGYLHDAQLARLYAACTALVWPTWYEGFGLPPLEAMACGAPVIVSNVASLPEVVGDAGILLDPHDTAAWTRAMQRAVEDSAHRTELRACGIAQAARFCWGSFVESTFSAYRAALA